MPFSPTTVKKLLRFTLVGTANHWNLMNTSIFQETLLKRLRDLLRWCPTIPFWSPKWSQTSPTGSAGRPSGLAGPGRPWLASRAARSRLPAGGLLCRGTREAQRREAARRRTPPPHSYHRRWVILYRISLRVSLSISLRISYTCYCHVSIPWNNRVVMIPYTDNPPAVIGVGGLHQLLRAAPPS